MDLLGSLAPLQRISQLCGLWHWRTDNASRQLQRSRWLQLYGVVVLLLSVGYLLYGLFNVSRAVDAIPDSGQGTRHIGHTVDSIQMVGIRLAHGVAIFEALWQQKAQNEFHLQLQQIDQEFASLLQLNVDHGALRRQLGRAALWMLGGYAISQGFILFTKLLLPDIAFLAYWLSYLLPLVVCGLRYFQVNTAIQIVQQRLQLLHHTLQSMQVDEVQPQQPQQQQPYICRSVKEELELEAKVADSMRRLTAARQLYQRLWTLVGLVNRCYGMSMLINLANDFLSITSNCYWIFLNFRGFASSPYDFLQILGSILWTAPHLVNVLLLALMCERAAYFTTRLALSLHQVRVDLQNDSQNALITQFSLQLLHQRLHFNAAGFFNVDCSLLYTIVGATTTYLIILIQFHMSEGSIGSG